MILSGRRVNDSMGGYVGQQLIKLLADRDVPLKKLRVGILGFTFKENVPDIRNSKVVDIYRELRSYGVEPLVHDPLAHAAEVVDEYQLELSALNEFNALDAVILAVPHADYHNLNHSGFNQMVGENGIFVDVKSCVAPGQLRSDIRYWSL